MEKLKKDLFNDPELEARQNRIAGGPCATSIMGGTFCCTRPFPPCSIDSVDVGF